MTSSISGTQSSIHVATPLAPKSLLIYYSYPSVINGASTLAAAAAALGSYDYVVLGDTLENPSHPDHTNTVAILANPAMAHTTVFGYIDLGVSTQNLSIAAIETRIDQWKATGAKGIFLDDFGYDFGTTRARQNTIVAYAHGKGLVVAANAFNPADAFGSQVDAITNPSGTPTVLNSSDFYLYESYQISKAPSYPRRPGRPKPAHSKVTRRPSASRFWLSPRTVPVIPSTRANSLTPGIRRCCKGMRPSAGVSTISRPITAQAPYRARPAIDPGTAFTSGVVNIGSSFGRDTNLGQIQVDASLDTGTFTTNPANYLDPQRHADERQRGRAVYSRRGRAECRKPGRRPVPGHPPFQQHRPERRAARRSGLRQQQRAGNL